MPSCSDKEAEQKYLNSTCYFIGPILKPALKDSTTLAQQLNATTAVTQVQDSWVSGAIFTASEVSLLCVACTGCHLAAIGYHDTYKNAPDSQVHHVGVRVWAAPARAAACVACQLLRAAGPVCRQLQRHVQQ